MGEKSNEIDIATEEIFLDSNLKTNNSVKKRLLLAIGICSLLFIIELVGGLYSDSVAILSDSFHMLSDVLGYVISFAAVSLSDRPKTKQYGYGYQRIEVLGALASISLIWLLTTGLLIEAFRRFYTPHPINVPSMLKISIAGVIFNSVLIFVFGPEVETSSPESNGLVNENIQEIQEKNLNIRAAILHAIGDLLCSVGVLVAAIVLSFRPDWNWIDPICTILFGVVAVLTTFKILQDIFLVLMQSAPEHISVSTIEKELLNVSNVIQVIDCNIWSLTTSELVAEIKVEVYSDININELNVVRLECKRVLGQYGVDRVTTEVHL